MRLSVASTGGATGSGSAGAAARFSAAYSLTGSTTQPSALWAAIGRAKKNRESRASAARDTGKRSRFMVILLLKSCALLRGTRRDDTARSPHKITRTLVRIEIEV